MADVPATGLRRALGFAELTASGVGIIVGAGIYVLIGAATKEAGEQVWLAFAVAGVLSAITALSYSELASMFPRASAEYEYTRNAFPGWFAFVVGWVMVAGLVVAAAAVALGFARYLGQFTDLPERVGALLLLALVTSIALGGIKNSARLTLALTAVQVGGLLLIVGVGITHVDGTGLSSGHGAGGVLSAAALVFFAFIGFDEVITLSEETRDPARTVPRALLAALGLSSLLYVAVAIVAVSVLGGPGLAASERPLADVMGHVVGGVSVDIVAVIALVSTTNTTLLALTAGSRLAYGMASQGAFPAPLARVSGRGVPAVTVGLCAVAAAGFVLVGNVSVVAGVTDFAVYLVFLAVNATVVILRVRRPGASRPFRVPWAFGAIPVLPLLGFAATVLMMTGLELKPLAIGGVVVAVGLVLSLVFSVSARRRKAPA
jgi:APA family basic amino acid/polyamine antiporter